MSLVTLLSLAAIELIAPAQDSVIKLLPDCQRAVITNETRVQREAALNATAPDGKAWRKQKDWRKSRDVAFAWRATEGEKGPWEVRLAKKADFSDARLFDFAAKKDTDSRMAFTNELKFANLEIATTYYWKVIAHEKGGDVGSEVRTFKTEDLAPRWIRIEGRVGNFRDLGGRIGLGGKRVRQGMIHRSSSCYTGIFSEGGKKIMAK